MEQGKDEKDYTIDQDSIEQYKKMEFEKIGEQYDSVAHKYDKYLEFMGYPDPDSIVEAITKVCEIPKDALINDFGMGTGIVGDKLHALGYTHIDGCDAS